MNFFNNFSLKKIKLFKYQIPVNLHQHTDWFRQLAGYFGLNIVVFSLDNPAT
jgi:hypothetical protein